MPPRASPKSFAPTCPGALSQCGSDNADYLRLLQQNESRNSYVPFGWGFTIYRAAFGPGSDERFATALRRLDSWVRFVVLSGRFSLLKFGLDYGLLKGLDPNPSELLAERLWNEVVEDYPDKDKNHSGGEDGDEDFTPVGKAFIRWGNDLGVTLDERNARYQNCLIIDDAVLDPRWPARGGARGEAAPGDGAGAPRPGQDPVPWRLGLGAGPRDRTGPRGRRAAWA